MAYFKRNNQLNIENLLEHGTTNRFTVSTMIWTFLKNKSKVEQLNEIKQRKYTKKCSYEKLSQDLEIGKNLIFLSTIMVFFFPEALSKFPLMVFFGS